MKHFTSLEKRTNFTVSQNNAVKRSEKISTLPNLQIFTNLYTERTGAVAAMYASHSASITSDSRL